MATRGHWKGPITNRFGRDYRNPRLEEAKAKKRETLEVGDGLGVAEEAEGLVGGGEGSGGGAEELEEAAEAAGAEEGEVRLGVAEAGAEGQRHLPVDPPPAQRRHQIPCSRRRRLLPVRTSRWSPRPRGLAAVCLRLPDHCAGGRAPHWGEAAAGCLFSRRWFACLFPRNYYLENEF